MKSRDWVSAEYREAVHELPCVVCQGPAAGHHSRTCPDGSNYGMGQKASDYEMFALCFDHHQHGPDALHSAPRRWEDEHGSELEFVKQTQAQLASLIPEEYFEWVRSKYRLTV